MISSIDCGSCFLGCMIKADAVLSLTLKNDDFLVGSLQYYFFAIANFE